MPTQVLILAAGRGSRLGPKTTEVPKPLLQIGPKHLVEHQLETLADAGLGPVAMVLGYHADEIEQIVGMRAEYLINARWATTNSLYSFLMAKDWIKDDLIVMNCDILFHPDIVNRILRAGKDTFAYDSSSGDGREHMKVQLDSQGRLARMSKEMRAEESDGENVGILYFQRSTAQLLVGIAERLVFEGRLTDWIGTAVQEMCSARPLTGVDVAGLPWAEIDFAFDLDRARKKVWPAIRNRRRTRLRRVVSAVAAVTTLVALLFGATLGQRADVGPGDAVEWESLPFLNGKRVRLTHGDKQQTWWLIKHGQSLTTRIAGPAEVKLDSRVVLDSDLQPTPYLVEISVDGIVVDWMRGNSTPSKTVRLDGEIVSKRERTALSIEDGQHELKLQISSVGGRSALLRLRQKEQPFDDD